MSDAPQLTWVGEMPLPIANLQIQAAIYVLEQWLRRIALAGLMARAGSRWLDFLPTDVLPEAKKSLAILRKRTFLDPENSDNIVWALTFEQLRAVLTDVENETFGSCTPWTLSGRKSFA